MTKEKQIAKILHDWTSSTVSQILSIREGHLTRIISGQLKSAIDSHGDITKHNLSSAAKRIAHALLKEIG